MEENKKEFANDWCFSGEVVRLQPWNEEKRKEFYGSIVIRGVSTNEESYYPSDCEITVYFREKAWNELSRKKKLYDSIECCGHFEKTATKSNPVKMIADMILE